MKAGCLRKAVFWSAAAKRSGATALLLVSAAYQRDAEAALRPLKASAAADCRYAYALQSTHNTLWALKL